ncbi:TetR/AcrR family transcriptional regulator [Dactylosporangium sp. CA-139066]|uniref:TetR/AcrR family transcriptional regulator n=1 Tax=Dactylosporangium sp. CA-139066 TaxID=3239930 RepID=UPI003D8D74B3
MSDLDDYGVPASIAAAWGRRDRPGYGPRPGLSLERIVATAVRVAAAEGLAAVSMVRLGKELGTSAMALYRYVAAKDELLDLMLDAGVGLPPEPPAGPEAGWRPGLERWSRAYLAALMAAPWMLQVPPAAPPITPNQIAWLEDCLAALSGTALGEREKLSVVMLLSGFVRSWAGTAVAAMQPPGERPPIDYGRALTVLATPDRFPAIAAAIAGGAIDDDATYDAEAEFAFGLTRVLDGIAALVDARHRSV